MHERLHSIIIVVGTKRSVFSCFCCSRRFYDAPVGRLG